MAGQIVRHCALELVGCGEIQGGIQAQGIGIRRQGRQLPQIPVSKAAIRVQAHLDDAGVQVLIEKKRQHHQHASQDAPVQ